MGWNDIIGSAVDGGAVIVLAVVVVFFLLRDTKERISEATGWAQRELDDKRLLLSVVQANTEAITSLREAVRELGRDRR